MADPANSPDAKQMTRWTDLERIGFLMAALEASGGIKWSTVPIPAGRTRKACTHMYMKMKKAVDEGTALGVKSESPATPKKKKGRPAKSKKVANGDDEQDDEEDDDVNDLNGAVDTPTPSTGVKLEKDVKVEKDDLKTPTKKRAAAKTTETDDVKVTKAKKAAGKKRAKEETNDMGDADEGTPADTPLKKFKAEDLDLE